MSFITAFDSKPSTKPAMPLPSRTASGRFSSPAVRPALSDVYFGAAKGKQVDASLAALQSKGYSYGKLTKEDQQIPIVVDLIYKIFEKLESMNEKATYLSDFEKNLKEGATSYVVYDSNDLEKRKIIGTATLRNDGYIFAVGVDEAYRQQGIARALMTTLIQAAKEKKLSEVRLTANNPNAIALYKSMGFQQTSEKPNAQGMHSFQLSLNTTEEKPPLPPSDTKPSERSVFTRVKVWFQEFWQSLQCRWTQLKKNLSHW